VVVGGGGCAVCCKYCTGDVLKLVSCLSVVKLVQLLVRNDKFSDADPDRRGAAGSLFADSVTRTCGLCCVLQTSATVAQAEVEGTVVCLEQMPCLCHMADGMHDDWQGCEYSKLTMLTFHEPVCRIFYLQKSVVTV
jgi:hypothetical protein